MNKDIFVLIACEQSQTVCTAFRRLGFSAYSNDIEKCYGGHPEWHILGDARQAIKNNVNLTLESGESMRIDSWSLIIAHPPCTMLCHVSAVALSQGKHTMEDVKWGAQFFMDMLNAPCPRVAVENPAPMKIAKLPRYNQIINPYEFGHPFSKRLCLWLKNLPPLLPTCYVPEHKSWHDHCAGTSRRRSKTFEGIAQAMAEQWGDQIVKEKSMRQTQ